MSNADAPPPSPAQVTASPPAPAPARSAALQTAPDTPTPPPPPPPPLLPPEPPATMPGATALARLARLDLLVVMLVLGFAFLTALFPVVNSDFLLHLATGRLIAQGAFTFGTDPFTFTSEGVRWIEHSWL